jgi:hypothetical protein
MQHPIKKRFNGHLVRACDFAAWGPLGGPNDIVHSERRSAEVLVHGQHRPWGKYQTSGQQRRWPVHGASTKFAQLIPALVWGVAYQVPACQLVNGRSCNMGFPIQRGGGDGAYGLVDCCLHAAAILLHVVHCAPLFLPSRPAASWTVGGPAAVFHEQQYKWRHTHPSSPHQSCHPTLRQRLWRSGSLHLCFKVLENSGEGVCAVDGTAGHKAASHDFQSL